MTTQWVTGVLQVCAGGSPELSWWPWLRPTAVRGPTAGVLSPGAASLLPSVWGHMASNAALAVQDEGEAGEGPSGSAAPLWCRNV